MKLAGKSGAALATAAFSLAVSGASLAVPTAAMAGDEAKIHCVGVNTCQGTSDCKTATSACAGQNSCKGQGFVALTASQCEKIGGTVEG